MIVITKIIVTPAMTGTMIYVTGRLWLLSWFGEERKVDSLVVVTIVLVGKDIAVDRGVDIVAVLSTKNKDSYLKTSKRITGNLIETKNWTRCLDLIPLNVIPRAFLVARRGP